MDTKHYKSSIITDSYLDYVTTSNLIAVILSQKVIIVITVSLLSLCYCILT